MNLPRRRFVLLAGLLLLGACATRDPYGAVPPPPIRHLIVISIDGLRPEFYLGDFDTPNLHRLATEGAHANAVEVVFPSVTYPAHTSILTGVRPARHGIVQNSRFGETGGMAEWFWEESWIRCRTLWDAAREVHRTVATFSWPCSIGAEVTFDVPEIWPVHDGESQVELVRQHMFPHWLPRRLEEANLMPTDDDLRDRGVADRFLERSAAYVLREYRPMIVFLHLIQADFAQHDSGRDSDRTRGAVAAIDGLIGDLLAQIDAAGLTQETLLLVTGDHGFINVEREIHVNCLLRDHGYIDVDGEGHVTGWRAIAWKSGAQAEIRLKDATPEGIAQLRALLEENRMQDGAEAYRVLGRDDLDALGYDPDAALAVAATPGWTMGGSARGAFVVSRGGRGDHGFLPSEAQMDTGFIAWGLRARAGAVVERMRQIDIAPTIAWLEGLEMPDCEGGAVRDLFTE